jgi:branched-chain amino acid transport system ATP-binding protein
MGRGADRKEVEIVSPLLEVRGLSLRFGGLMALEEVGFSAKAGEITAVVGPNGAGKTSAINCISGVLRPAGGKVLFRGRDVTGLAAHRFARLGLVRTFQNLRIFSRMNVLENIMVGLHGATGREFLSAMFRLPGFRVQEESIRNRAWEALERYGLGNVAFRSAGQLAYGDQKRLELARAMVSGPKLVLLDEPVAGLNPAETEMIGGLIQTVRDQGVAVILVEHDMSLVMRISDKVVVLSGGRKIAEGPPSAIQRHPEVISTYLGGGEEFGLHA